MKQSRTNLYRQAGEQVSCPKDPYQVMEDRSDYIDFQVLKIQECPDAIPTGEVPRTYQVCCQRDLVNKLVPGTRVTITGVYTTMDKKYNNRGAQGIRQPYIICYSMHL